MSAPQPRKDVKRRSNGTWRIKSPLFYNNVDQAVRNNDRFDDGLAVERGLDLLQGQRGGGDLVLRRVGLEREGRADLSVDLDGVFDAGFFQVLLIEGWPRLFGQTFPSAEALPELF